MYRRSKFVEILTEIREEMAQEADYDLVLFTEMVRTGSSAVDVKDRKRLVETKAATRSSEDEVPLRRTGDLMPK